MPAAPAAEPARSELPPGWPQVLRAVVEAPQWWITRVELARVLVLDDKRGRPLPTLAKRLDAMLAAKWLEPWQADGGLAVTLSPLAAAKLGVKLSQPEGPEQEPRWIDSHAVLWPRVNQERHFAAVELEVISSAFDPRPMPDEAAEEAEEFRREVQAAVRELLRGDDTRASRLLRSRPRIVLTGCALVWAEQTVRPGEEFQPRPWCSACKGSALADGAVCARCFAWCLDEYFRPKARELAA